MVRQLGGPPNQAMQRSMRLGFISEVIGELRKVEWPNRQQVVRLSVIVILISTFIGVVLGVEDFIFTYVVDKVFLGI